MIPVVQDKRATKEEEEEALRASAAAKESIM